MPGSWLMIQREERYGEEKDKHSAWLCTFLTFQLTPHDTCNRIQRREACKCRSHSIHINAISICWWIFFLPFAHFTLLIVQFIRKRKQIYAIEHLDYSGISYEWLPHCEATLSKVLPTLPPPRSIFILFGARFFFHTFCYLLSYALFLIWLMEYKLNAHLHRITVGRSSVCVNNLPAAYKKHKLFVTNMDSFFSAPVAFRLSFSLRFSFYLGLSFSLFSSTSLFLFASHFLSISISLSLSTSPPHFSSSFLLFHVFFTPEFLVYART